MQPPAKFPGKGQEKSVNNEHFFHSSSCRRSDRQSGPADRQPVLPEPPAAQSSHGGCVRPHQPPAAAQLPGGVAAGPHRVGDEKRRRRVPAAATQGGVRCVAITSTFR